MPSRMRLVTIAAANQAHPGVVAPYRFPDEEAVPAGIFGGTGCVGRCAHRHLVGQIRISCADFRPLIDEEQPSWKSDSNSRPGNLRNGVQTGNQTALPIVRR